MASPEERFTANLDLCEKLLKAEKDAVNKGKADAIEFVLAKKEEAFSQLAETGAGLGYSPSERVEFSSRMEQMFAAQKSNLQLMENVISEQRSEGNVVRKGQARLRMVKGAYRP
jgi:hypothetical protein